MAIGDDTFATRRKLPHLENDGKTYFVTFAAKDRWLLSPVARELTIATAVRGHESSHWLRCIIAMPDHVHIVFTPYESMREVVTAIKNTSAHSINRALQRTGPVWQREYFDRILRTSEDLHKKCEYVCDNPVRAGLVASADEYPWLWRCWKYGPRRTAALH